MKGDTQDVGGHQAVGAAGQMHPIQRPVQSAGVEAELRVHCARGRQTGADPQDWILGGDHCYICGWTHTHSLSTATFIYLGLLIILVDFFPHMQQLIIFLII